MTIAVRSDSKIKTLADINDPKVTLATLTVPEGIDVAKRMAPKATIASFASVDQQSLALRSGRVQAFLVDLPIGMWYAATSPDIRILPKVYGGYQNYGIAYKQGELSWSQFLDGFVTDLTTGYTYIEYTRLYHKYFKVDPPPQRDYKIPGPG
jgi:polar amino acid transport system substrate-binding protein